jgi:2-polyprenyl-6-hydroxyphenyl methylase/3-demethylubiquinone-9 3-methyltransferase
VINNEFYGDLGEKWYSAEGDAIALLRYENAAKLPWVLAKIAGSHAPGARVLDLGCGGGFLTMGLAARGYACTGLDVSEGVIREAQSRDSLCQWTVAPCERTPFADASFDVVCAMDVLEHVQDFRVAIREALRVLRPDGTLCVHTFNRTWLAWLIAERGVEWFIRGTPKHLHDWQLFVKPSELEHELALHGFGLTECRGIGPKILSRAFAQLLLTRRVPQNFRFALGESLQLGYLACARRV